MAEEMFDKYDKMVIAGLHQEYFGSLLFSRGAMSQHEFVARAVAELTGAQQGTREYEDLVAKLTQSVKKLAEWGVIEVKEYEARLTAWGQSVANSISAEEFKKIKDELAKEASRKRRCSKLYVHSTLLEESLELAALGHSGRSASLSARHSSHSV